MNANVLMIAARAPVPGQTKTRLGHAIGMNEAARIYEGFLIDLASRLGPEVQDAGIDIAWTFSPPECDFGAELHKLGIDANESRLVPQSGDSWAIRQDNLMRWASDAGYERGILIASDSPHLETSFVLEAFEQLAQSDVVIGRVSDGGYYLIGMHGYHDVLLNVPMSTAEAGDALVANVRALGKSIAEVSPTFDVDTIDELRLLATSLAPDGGNCPATWRVLQKLSVVS